MQNIHEIPTNKTMYDILAEIDDTPCRSSEFIEMNKRDMVSIGTMDHCDYEIFWACMKIFEVHGINYFPDYICLRAGRYGDFSKGIDKWFESQSAYGWTPKSEKFIELIKKLRFFKVPCYDGIDISIYEEKCKKVNELSQIAADNERQRRIEKKDETIQQQIEDYFNYECYSESEFNKLTHDLILNEQNSISINEALALAQTAPDNMYIVFLKKDNRVCYVGKTGQPLYYIGKYYKRFDADSAYFTAVPDEYIDDLVIHMKVFYDVDVDKIRCSARNRKYAILKRAIFVYKRAESIPRKQVLQAIKRGNIRVIDLDDKHKLIDKIELHKNLYGTTLHK